MPVTVLIASPERLATFRGREEFLDAVVFADTDALRALEAITRQRPDAVALDRLFATTSRGTALINRIKADPALASCEIRLVPEEPSLPAPVLVDAMQSRAASTAPSIVTLTPDEPSSIPDEPSSSPFPVAIVAFDGAGETARMPLDQRGTRGAPRYDMPDGLEVLVDGNPATLVDLSQSGAQVVSPTILRPNQRIRLSLPDARRPLRCSAAVAWAVFEMPRQGPQYRAGLAFIEAEAEAIQRFIDANRRS